MKLNLRSIFAYWFKILKIYFFWLFLFILWRDLFILINHSLIYSSGVNNADLYPILWHALELDFSMASYIMVFVYLFLSIALFIDSKFINKLINSYNYILIVLYSLLGVGEIALYPEWKTKVNAKALEYLTRPAEVMGSNKTGDTIWQLLLWILISVAAIYLYKYIAGKRAVLQPRSNVFIRYIVIFFTGVGIFIGMRGGIQEIPISLSQSYFSKKDVVNDISVNSGWNLVYNILNTEKINDVNIFKTYPQKEAQSIVKQLHYCKKDTTISIINQAQPNVLFIILESWSGDLVGALGGKKGITPNFDRLSREGLFFTHFYANGNRSQQGLAAILGCFPALPITTLTTQPEKMRKTATITSVFNDHHYSTAFYYGGELRYGNIKAYLIHNGFQTIKEDADWDSSIPRGKLGIHDGYMFTLLAKALEKTKQPFFVDYFTLSSHSPYDQPMKPHIKWNDSEDDFHNSVYYSDSCIGNFMRQAKQSSWYKNTLIVFVADHSHQTYTHRSIATAAYRHIPLLITGGALKNEYKGKTINTIFAQVDIGKTILKQLHFNADTFHWSKDMFNPYEPSFAYFELNEGFGWIRGDGYLSYDHFNKRFIDNTYKNKTLRDKMYKQGAAYLQEVFQEFIDL